MDDNYTSILGEMTVKLERLKVLDQQLQVFGSNKHRYETHPLSDTELKHLEDELGVRLPEDFRKFLQVIGYGAGPYYGIFSPDKMREVLIEDVLIGEESFLDPSRPFPISHEQADECWRFMGEELCGYIEGAWPTDGCIPLCDEGCLYSSWLVTAGDLAGSVWSRCWDDPVLYNLAIRPPGITRFLKYSPGPVWEPALSPLPTFLEWYGAWLSKCLSDFEELQREGI